MNAGKLLTVWKKPEYNRLWQIGRFKYGSWNKHEIHTMILNTYWIVYPRMQQMKALNLHIKTEDYILKLI